MNIYFFYISLFFYLLSTAFYLLFLTMNRNIIEKLGHYSLFAGFCIHFLATLVRYFNAGYTPITNIYESLSFFSLCIAGFFLYLKRTYRIEIIGCIVLPILAVLLIWASTFPAEIRPLPPVLKSCWLPIHTIFSFIGNAIFFISFFISLLYLVVERGIKKKRFPSIATRFPSLEILDLINYRCVSYGFPFLTVGIITGSIWASAAWGSYWNWDPKETWSLVTWIVYAILIHNRLTIGWRGRKTAYMMIIGFISILITFLGVNFFAGGFHSYL
ncbi:MAG: c-type cytochrome biogenesis protein CcsB [Deltaproteobacteria bacterium]